MSDPTLVAAQALRGWEEENPWKSVGLGFVPGVGTAMGIADLAAALRDPNASKMDVGLATLGVIPGGKLLKKAGNWIRGVPTPAEIPGVSNIDVYHGSRGAITDPEFRPGAGEGLITEGPGFYTTTGSREARSYANEDYNNPSRLVRPPVLNQYELPDEVLPRFHNKFARAPHQTTPEAMEALTRYATDLPKQAPRLHGVYVDVMKRNKTMPDPKTWAAMSPEEQALYFFNKSHVLGKWKEMVGAGANPKIADLTRQRLLAAGLRGIKASTDDGLDKLKTHTGIDQTYYSVFDPQKDLQFKKAFGSKEYKKHLVDELRKSGPQMLRGELPHDAPGYSRLESLGFLDNLTSRDIKTPLTEAELKSPLWRPVGATNVDPAHPDITSPPRPTPPKVIKAKSFAELVKASGHMKPSDLVPESHAHYVADAANDFISKYDSIRDELAKVLSPEKLKGFDDTAKSIKKAVMDKKYTGGTLWELQDYSNQLHEAVDDFGLL